MSPNKPCDDQQRFGAISETHPALISTKVVMMKWSNGYITFFSCNMEQRFCAYINGVGM
jgi:hypothetical protein